MCYLSCVAWCDPTQGRCWFGRFGLGCLMSRVTLCCIMQRFVFLLWPVLVCWSLLCGAQLWGFWLWPALLFLIHRGQRSKLNQKGEESWGNAKKREKIKKVREKTRSMKRGAADRCGSILSPTTFLTIGHQTFSSTLINVATHPRPINTSIIGLNITLPSGPHETESYSSCTSSLIQSQLSALCKDKTTQQACGWTQSGNDTAEIVCDRQERLKTHNNQWWNQRLYFG